MREACLVPAPSSTTILPFGSTATSCGWSMFLPPVLTCVVNTYQFFVPSTIQFLYTTSSLQIYACLPYSPFLSVSLSVSVSRNLSMSINLSVYLRLYLSIYIYIYIYIYMHRSVYVRVLLLLSLSHTLHCWFVSVWTKKRGRGMNSPRSININLVVFACSSVCWLYDNAPELVNDQILYRILAYSRWYCQLPKAPVFNSNCSPERKVCEVCEVCRLWVWNVHCCGRCCTHVWWIPASRTSPPTWEMQNSDSAKRWEKIVTRTARKLWTSVKACHQPSLPLLQFQTENPVRGK